MKCKNCINVYEQSPSYGYSLNCKYDPYKYLSCGGMAGNEITCKYFKKKWWKFWVRAGGEG